MEQIQKRDITAELTESYLDYAMSVIVSRALPDARDGLKPVQRRILYAMREMGLSASGRFRKSATVVGETLGKYHPHGDISVYDAMVRLAQDFSLRYPLVQGQGNFGCFTGDTKVKLTDGRTVTFFDLVHESKSGKKHFAYTYNMDTKRIEIAEIHAPRMTETKAALVKVMLDNGEEIRCTPSHRFLLRDSAYRKAKDLQEGDSLMPIYTRFSTKEDDPNIANYEMILQPGAHTWEYTHHLADEWNMRNGRYLRSAGKIRHHLDFNKRNNDPTNIQRLNWEAHWRAHYELASERHKTDPEYRRKLAEGRAAYYARQDVKEKIAARMRQWNKKMWKSAEYRAKKRRDIQAMWTNAEYRNFMARLASERLMGKWREECFRESMSRKKSEEMKARWQDPEYRKQGEVRMKGLSDMIWSDPKHRAYISDTMKKLWRDKEYRDKLTKLAKERWDDPGYRSKFTPEHFANAAHKLWADPKWREFHREKIKKQWAVPGFKEKFVTGVRRALRKRIARNPNVMKELNAKAVTVLKTRWADPGYKETVIRSKILGYVSRLLSEYNAVTPEVYQSSRTNNCIPRIERALQHFSNFEDLISQAKQYNHKIIRVEFLSEREDVYDLTIEGTHNFALSSGIFVHNSIDGDAAAAHRYTEAKLSRLAEEMLADIEKDTVDFRDNFDATHKEPTVLPTKIPQLLLNGTVGIAVGMATNIPPHNVHEVMDALLHLADHPGATTEDLVQFVQGPDFPTGGIIFDKKAILEAYATGRGPILTRGVVEVAGARSGTADDRREDTESKKGDAQIIITAIPYQVSKSGLVAKMAELVRDKKIEGIRDLRDESDKEGMRVVVYLKSDAYPQKIVNALYKYTELERSFHVNLLALEGGIQPEVMSLKTLLESFLDHRKTVVERRTRFDLERAKERAHILEGLVKALDHIDAVIKTIRHSKDRAEAQANLVKRFDLSEVQAHAILEMRLSLLANLEAQKIKDELEEKRALIGSLTELLKDPKKMLAVVKDECREIKEKYGDPRRTAVRAGSPKEIGIEDIVPEEEVVVALTRGGYIKRMNPELYRAQHRGGKGVIGITPKEEDLVEHFVTANTHANLLFFTDAGKVYQTKAYEIPEGTRQARGKPLVGFLQIAQNERVTALLDYLVKPSAKNIQESPAAPRYLVMATKRGVIKKTPLEDFANVRRNGLIALSLKKGDFLGWAKGSSGTDEIMLVTKKGQAIRFNEKEVRPMGRTATGVGGIGLKTDDAVVGMTVINQTSKSRKEADSSLLVLTERGYGKKTPVKSYRKQRRAGMGIKTAQITSKTGLIMAARLLDPSEEDLIAISQRGQVIRVALSSVPKLGRQTQGVRIMRLDSDDGVASATCV